MLMILSMHMLLYPYVYNNYFVFIHVSDDDDDDDDDDVMMMMMMM